MLWLFGQIWLWLLLSFALGAVVTWFILSRTDRARSRQAPPPTESEQTRYLAASSFEDHPDEYDTGQYAPVRQDSEHDAHEHAAAYPPHAPEEWPPEPPETGRREGQLPDAQWPTEHRGEENGSGEEPAWPQEDDWPANEGQPGRAH